jgi:hypothetical protein
MKKAHEKENIHLSDRNIAPLARGEMSTPGDMPRPCTLSYRERATRVSNLPSEAIASEIRRALRVVRLPRLPPIHSSHPTPVARCGTARSRSRDAGFDRFDRGGARVQPRGAGPLHPHPPHARSGRSSVGEFPSAR